MTDFSEQAYEALKARMCKAQPYCSAECPLFALAQEKGLHACGSLCELAFLKDPQECIRRLNDWAAEHPEN